MLDAGIAILILLVGYMLISSFTPQSTTDVFQETLANDLIELLATTKIQDLCTNIEICDCPDYPELETNICPIQGLNKNNSVLEMVGEMYNREFYGPATPDYEYDFARNFVLDVIGNTVDPLFRTDLYGVKIELIDSSPINPPIYITTYADDNQKIINKLAIKRVIFGYIEDPSDSNINTAVQFWGPYTIQLEIWQRPT